MAKMIVKTLGGPIGTMMLTKQAIPGNQWQYSVTVTIPANGGTMLSDYPKAHIKRANDSIIAIISPLQPQGGDVYFSGLRTSTDEPMKARVFAKFVEPEQDKEQNF